MSPTSEDRTGLSAGSSAGTDQPELKIADVSHVRRRWLDLVYAEDSPAQRLDIYLPDTGDGPFPTLVWIHGGAFEMGDKRSEGVLPVLTGLRHGFAIASINYRLSGEATFPAAVRDVKAALRWLRANGAEYDVDGGRLAVGGQSAGGHLAAMACVTGGLGLFEDGASDDAGRTADVRAAVDLFGPTDFLKMDEQLAASGLGPTNHSLADSPESRYLGGRITEIPDEVRRANPITYVHADMPPILIQHGTADDEVPVQQSVEFAKAIEELAGRDRFELDVLEGEGHSGPGFWTQENMDRVFGFVGRHLK